MRIIYTLLALSGVVVVIALANPVKPQTAVEIQSGVVTRYVLDQMDLQGSSPELQPTVRIEHYHPLAYGTW